MKKHLIWLVMLLAIVTTLAACNSATPEPAPAQPQAAAVAPTEEVGVLGGAVAPPAPATQEAAVQPTTEAPAAEPTAAVEGTTATTETIVSEVETVSEETAASVPAGHYGLVVGNIDDKGFNELAWQGMQRAAEELGVKVQFLSDPNAATVGQRINQFVNLGYDGIVTVGFEMADETKKASLANPNLPFAIVDFPGQTENDLGLLYAMDDPAFMAGYLAAGMSQTGTVCTYGGEKIPPVMIFMVGFESGVEYYNAQKGVKVQLLGWQTDPNDPSGGDGAFAQGFTNQAFGRTIAEEYAQLGCDIIFPVAGAVGLGTAEVAQNLGLTVIGVDADQVETNPEYADVYLTSVRKRVGLGVYLAVKSMHEGTFTGGTNLVGTLENEGVELSPFHSFEDKVPQQLKDELAQIKQDLIDGKISTGWPIGLSKVAGRNEGNLNLVALRNATYNVEYTADGTAELSFGTYREPAAPDSASEIVVRMGNEVAYGDLNGDGVDEAVVVLTTNTGGSGTFYDLAVVADVNGSPTHIASAPLGDRVQVKSITVVNGQIQVTLLTQGPNDPMCCPTQEVVKTFVWQDNQLVELSSEEVAAAPAPVESGATPAPAAPPAASTGGGVTQESMANATYNVEGPASGTATLVNGEYREPAAPGSASEIVVTLSPLSILGDLNGDGVTDGAAILMVDMGGSGTFYYLAAVVDQNGTPVNVDTVLLGDRVQIQSVAIKDGAITLNMLTAGPDDPLCCPTQEVTVTYKLEGDKLVEQTGSQ